MTPQIAGGGPPVLTAARDRLATVPRRASWPGRGGVLVSAGATALLAACGTAGSGSEPTWSAAGASYGVDQATWPESMDAARDLLAALPEDLEGVKRDAVDAEAEVDEAWAGASYGDGRTSVLVSDGDFEGIPAADTDAQDKLGAMFGLVFGCDMDTYVGTIEAQGIGPGGGEVAPGAPAWFACRIDGAEGHEEYTGHAVGWTSTTEVAWLVVADDEQAVRTMVEAMQEAAG